MNISVVIPNYNGVHLFPETLPALKKALEQTGGEHEIIIVDDASTDNSLEFLEKYDSGLVLLQNARNSGFSVTVNKGIYAAKYELILLLNSDVRLQKSYFNAQLRYFEDPDTFGVMGKIVGWNDSNIQDGAKYPEFTGFKLKTSLNFQVLPDDQSVYTLYLSGANALIRKDKLLLLNGMDENYSPFYMEDVDLSVRAWRFGLKCYYEPHSVCHHKTSESIRSKEKKDYIRTIYNRNKLFFHAVHLNGWRFAGWGAQVSMEILFRLITFRWDFLKSVAELLKNWQKVHSSSTALNDILITQGSSRSLKDIESAIKKSLKGRQLDFFRR